MTAQVLWMNIPLMVLAFGAWVGVPLWLVLRHPDRHPSESRSVPAYLRETARGGPPGSGPAPTTASAAW